MKKIITHISTLFLLVVITSSCGDKKEDAVAEGEKGTKKVEETKDNISDLLSGTMSKTWHIAKQIDASGDKEKVTSEEKDETLSLFKNGTFSITDAEQTSTGTWSTEGSHTLIMHFEGKDVTESFAIMNLTKEKVILKAADGSEMVLKEN